MCMKLVSTLCNPGDMFACVCVFWSHLPEDKHFIVLSIDLGEIHLPVVISVCLSVHLLVFVSFLHLHVGYNWY